MMKRSSPKSRLRCKYSLFLAFLLIDAIHARNFLISVILKITDDPYESPYTAAMITPGIQIAVDSVNNDTSLLPDDSLRAMVNDSGCNTTQAAFTLTDMRTFYDPDVIVGPACWLSMDAVAPLAGHWNLPILSGAAEDPTFSDRSKFPTLTRTYPHFQKLSYALIKILSYFYLGYIGLLYDVDNQSNYIMAYSLNLEVTLTPNVTFPSDAAGSRSFTAKRTTLEYRQLVYQDVTSSSRIIVIIASADEVREIMLHAFDHGMINGEYAFFNIELYRDPKYGEYPWKRNDDRDEDAKKAYEALMTVTLLQPSSPEYMEFSNEVKSRAKADYNFTYEDDVVNNFVGAFHDAVILYALALNETLAAGGDPRDGIEVTRRMWNRTFKGITGNVTIDDNGDRDADYSLLDMTDPGRGTFEVVLNYYGDRKVVEKVADIHWPGGATGPPPDVPVCGFQNEKCPPEEEFPLLGIIGIVLACLVVIVIVIALLVFRKYKLEAELAKMTWKVNWEDITLSKTDRSRVMSTAAVNAAFSKSQVTRRSSTRLSSFGADDMDKQIFTRVAQYKGNVVAIKKVNKKKVELTRDVLLELKCMRDLEHNHIVRFVGACVDAPHIAILTEYCPKGSLQDILENDVIKLDWVFRYSLMYDIVKGLHFLQHSAIKYHGNLKSSNCVVDSRFVLKITDFGLQKFKEDSKEVEHTHAYYQKQLWRAPEMLRDPNRKSSQEGDVYGFGIILQEIVQRSGPYESSSSSMSPQEIVERVKNVETPPFRPVVNKDTCPPEIFQLMERCWAELPTNRPDLNELRSTVRKLNKNSDGDNILDNLLQRMEQYANNLESLVEERTEAFLEEKRKSEELLYSILPNSVAKQLTGGQSVEPESFEMVTIYFSDVVGFTALSAGSTPMQVVDLLNDLYTCFDTIINNFDVYKVETIGDAYMVVSGLPQRNGSRHAREIARMSLALLDAVGTFRIRHRPNDQLKLRIGIHSGPCVTGVVGVKMPRYCLFGDTVNTASRMESNGEPLKVHVSLPTKMILDTFGTFHLQLRGEIEMKGKGKQTTYWLLGERPTSSRQDSRTTLKSS
ncbi:atrial natriuretic peptide receptor 1-like isoform X3 [Ptychodera flava]|uniref:atrial natriuretic peptide receptor 1-like isoform X3 n=1 Tax=Ptychodera flava TaxID=63121 RepID=UPI003969EC0B